MFKNATKSTFVVACALFLLALGFRLFFLFFVSGSEYCGWYHDSYHHWQIAYYTLKTGLAQGRMWDLNGMEYFWGLLPTLTESFLLWAFNTTSIAPFRIFNSLMGSLSVCLTYLLGKRYFSERIGLLAAILAAICPVLMEVDTSGMLDPMGVTFLLLALLFYGRNTFACGFFSGLTSLSHIEFWFLALGLCGCYLVYEKSIEKFIPSVLGWLAPMVPYFLFLQTRTGDWLYAFRWNYICSVKGEWIKDIQVPFQAQIMPRGVAVTFFVLSIAALLYLIKFKPKQYPIHTFFLIKIAMQGIIFGLTAYIVPYIAMYQIGRLFIDRLFALNYYYISVLVVFGLKTLSAKLPTISVKSAIKLTPSRMRQFLFLLIVIVYFLSFPYVNQQYFNHTYYDPYVHQISLADWIVSRHQGGTVISSLVIVNYRLINRGIPYENVLGSLYCPHDNITKAYKWLKTHNVTWIIADQDMKKCFPMLTKEEPPFHIRLAPIVYYVNQTELVSILGTG